MHIPIVSVRFSSQTATAGCDHFGSTFEASQLHSLVSRPQWAHVVVCHYYFHLVNVTTTLALDGPPLLPSAFLPQMSSAFRNVVQRKIKIKCAFAHAQAHNNAVYSWLQRRRRRRTQTGTQPGVYVGPKNTYEKFTAASQMCALHCEFITDSDSL